MHGGAPRRGGPRPPAARSRAAAAAGRGRRPGRGTEPSRDAARRLAAGAPERRDPPGRGWSALAVALHRRRAPDVGPWPAWLLAVVLGATHALRSLDGGPAGAYSLVAAALLLLVGGRALAHARPARPAEPTEPAPSRYAHSRRVCAGDRTASERLAHQHGAADPVLAARLRDAALRGVRCLADVVAAGDSTGDETGDGVDVLGVVRSVVEGRRLRGTQITIEADTNPRLLRTQGRPADLATTILELVVNAEQHGPGAPVRLGLLRQGADVLVVATDAGPGVAPERFFDLFDRGVRGQGSSGRGLGLHTARARARAAGGELRLAPSLVGARFELRLPVAAAPRTASATTPALAAAAS